MSVAPLLVKQCWDTKSLLRFEKFMKRHMCRSKHKRDFKKKAPKKSKPNGEPYLSRAEYIKEIREEKMTKRKAKANIYEELGAKDDAYHSFMECAGTGSLFGQLSDGTQIRLDNVHFAPIMAAIIMSPNSVEDIQIMRFGNELVRFDNLTLTLHKKSVIGEAIGEAIGELQTVGVNVQIPTYDCQSVSVVQPSLEPRIIEVYDLSDDELAAVKLTFMPLQLVIVIQVTLMLPLSQMVRMSGTIALVILDMLNLDN
ncbi:hypothetical protein HF325_005957 [Metschnikowia pulcherrima]|uniref:Uncharacterized protein n=1 Tax=Metschnikowia pulcherrima TaxID=27326 RepID=A0A8H7GMJ0_9ASCO|nr:hypothetical protein HF325_005957 [Metschnikowia pulcherrima]